MSSPAATRVQPSVDPAEPTAVTVPLERLEADIVSLCSQLAAGSARLVKLIGEFDARGGAGRWGMATTAAWLSWQCGIGDHAAREQVRVARALRDLPLVAAEFAAGRLSYSKVRAVTRIGHTDNEELLVMWARHSTAAQLERVVSTQRRVRRRQDAKQRHAQRFLSYGWEDDGSMVGRFRLPPEHAQLLLDALEHARDQLRARQNDAADSPVTDHPTDTDADTDGRGNSQRQRPDRPSVTSADALVELATRYLAAPTGSPDSEPGPAVEIVLHATEADLAAEEDTSVEGVTSERGLRLHPDTARRMTCDCRTSTLRTDRFGNPLHLGRRTRRIEHRLARAVRHRDANRCQAPGCQRRTAQIHHVWHWACGGPTCIDNLISLCDQHHWYVHEGGWTIHTDRPGAWTSKPPTGGGCTPATSPLHRSHRSHTTRTSPPTP